MVHCAKTESGHLSLRLCGPIGPLLSTVAEQGRTARAPPTVPYRRGHSGNVYGAFAGPTRSLRRRARQRPWYLWLSINESSTTNSGCISVVRIHTRHETASSGRDRIRLEHPGNLRGLATQRGDGWSDRHVYLSRSLCRSYDPRCARLADYVYTPDGASTIHRERSLGVARP